MKCFCSATVRSSWGRAGEDDAAFADGDGEVEDLLVGVGGVEDGGDFGVGVFAADNW